MESCGYRSHWMGGQVQYDLEFITAAGVSLIESGQKEVSLMLDWWPGKL